MRVRVDPERCMGHAMCATFAAEVYRVNDGGFNEMGEFEPPAELREAALRGSRACPERAITVAPDD